jgi:hypothetical protein
VLIRKELVTQTTNDILRYLYEEFKISPEATIIKNIIDNNLGFIIETLGEQAVEVDLS